MRRPARQGIRMAKPPATTPARATGRYPLWRLIRANFYDFGLLLRESWVALSGFALLTLIGTLYLHYGSPYQIGFAPALYETLKLLTLQSSLGLPTDPV